MALTHDDLRQIKTIVKDAIDSSLDEKLDEKFQAGFSSIWDYNLEPTLNTLMNDVHNIKRDVSTLQKDMVTKHHVDSRFDALERSMAEHMTEPSIMRDRKLDEKTNVVAKKLGVKTVFTRTDVVEIERITPFAVKPAVD